MNKKNIKLDTIDVDVQILPDNTLDLYLSTPSSGGEHYIGVTPEQVGDHVAGLIDCLADAQEGMEERELIHSGCHTDLREDLLLKQFSHYIDRKRYNINHPSDSQDGLYTAGECAEAEKWMSLYGINLDYARVMDLVNYRREPFQLSFDLLKNTDDDFVVISADVYTLGEVKGYLVLRMTDDEEDEDNITANILFVPELSVWSEDAKQDVLYAEGLEDTPSAMDYAMAAATGPKVVLSTMLATEHGPWDSMSIYQDAFQELRRYTDNKSKTIPAEDLDFQGEQALMEILG